ncbi:hypothetical protein [Psychromonas sp. KJ10-2]|uniref:hypothetical protein n=1 Tax=Psychromonas sp. KJ10-2 TaxID=3391822 RepID=UPI0039B4033F
MLNTLMLVQDKLNTTIQVSLLVLLCLLSAPAVQAHSLPGSVLTLSEAQNDTLTIAISFPLEDLIIAAPELEGLMELEDEQKLPEKSLKQLNTYLQAHMFILSGTKQLTLLPQQAEIDVVYHEHLGYFRSLVVDLTAKLQQNSSFPLRLSYDVIMHEVRNHRATVYWQEADNSLTTLSNFGFKELQGNQFFII